MSKRLLLADDSITIQKVIGITFANEDFELDIVDNGDAALEHARQKRPDIVLADVYMPGKNGYEVCAQLKGEPALQTVPVLLLTGTFEPFDEEKAKQSGADSWIAKPFESQALIDRVEELLSRPARVPEAVAAPVAPAPAELPAEPAVEELEEFDEFEAFEEESAVAESEALGVEDLADLPEAEEVEAAEPAEEGEDIWGSVSFEENDLMGDLEGLAEEAPAAAEPAAVKPAPAPPEAPAAAADAWEEGDEIFDLDDADLLDESDLLGEEDLLEPEAALPVEAAPDEVIGGTVLSFDEEESDEPIVSGWEMPETEEESVDLTAEPAGEDAIFFDEDPEELGAELEIASEPAAQPAAEEPAWSGPIFEPEEENLETVPLAGASAPQAPEPVPAPLAAAESVPTQVPTADVQLDETQVAQIVERIAAEVVERLAGTLLEKIAWEVVPDLAENMIREELDKIKAGAA